MNRQFEYQSRNFSIYIMISPFRRPRVVVNGWMSHVKITDGEGTTEKAIEEAVIKFIGIEPELKTRITQ
jgi:hypothetical protein